MTTILFVLTAADRWTLSDGTEQPTGYWAEEAIGPYRVFKEAGYEIATATPDGVPPTVDAASLTPEFNGGAEGAREMQDAVRAATELAEPLRLEDVHLGEYAAVFVPGGWGPMEDLSVDPDVGKLMAGMLTSDKPLALVCHGPAALLTTAGPDGRSPFAGYRLTSLSNAEERLNGLADRARWLLEDRLVELGVEYRAGEPFAPHVEVDRNLYTGQNPASAVPLAKEVLGALKRTQQDATDNANIALVRRLYDSRMTPEVSSQIIAPDLVFDVTPGFPGGGIYHGWADVGQDFFGSIMPSYDDFYAGAEHFYADDENHVFVLGHYHATPKGKDEVQVRFIHLWTIRDGKLARMQQAADSYVLREALSLT